MLRSAPPTPQRYGGALCTACDGLGGICAQIIIDQRYGYYCQRIGFRTQCAMISVLYRQILDLTPGA
eukprot:COSAG01_NODE_17487_length_1147_cov_1.921756_1_plen_66_part_10